MVREALKRAIDIAGSEKKLGALIGHSQNAIWQAKKLGSVSPRLAAKIEAATGVPARELCPDFPWPAATSSAEQASAS